MKIGITPTLNLLIATVLLSSTVVFSSTSLAQSQSSIASQGQGQSVFQFQMAEPKLDTSTPAPAAKSEPLKGGVQHHQKKDKKNKKFKLSQEKSQLDMNLQNQNARLQSNLNQGFFNSQLQSSIGIIGVKFLCQQGYSPVVNNVFPGTPAFSAGIVPEDVIVAVDGVPTAGLNREECYDLIVGTPNTPVTLSLRHNGEFRAKTLTRMDFNDIKDPRIRQAYLSDY